jgi:hypothetical protein
VRHELLGKQFAACLRSLEASLIAQVDVMPAGEEILDVPNALAMTHQDQFSRHA